MKNIILMIISLLLTVNYVSAMEYKPSSGKVEKAIQTSQFDEKIYRKFDQRIKSFQEVPIEIKGILNPCMAFGTTLGEAGITGVSSTTSTAFNTKHFSKFEDIKWNKLADNIEKVDSLWYITFSDLNVNTAVDGEAKHMPTSLLQNWSKENNFKNNLGVGSYQISTKDWSFYDLDTRVNPIYGFEASIYKAKRYLDTDVKLHSDVSLFACMSLSHQGPAFFKSSWGQEIIKNINKKFVQKEIWLSAKRMYDEVISGEKIATPYKYAKDVESKTGIKFSQWKAGSPYRTNQGTYTLVHTISYCFYRIMFNEGRIPE